jgi:A/G-specific adenine glycosylase
MFSTVLRRPGGHGTIRPVAKDTTTIEAVCSWFETAARQLPWRATSPWGVLVSEFMLQQTPVARVEPQWWAWMDRWPEPVDLAAEPAGEAVRAWGRLGYPRRALRLHAAAVAITDRYGGQVPSDEQDLLALPGVGEYTAAAVRAFAFGLPSVVLDVNVRRVLARAWSGMAEPPGHLTAVERALAQGLAELAPNPAQWAAASMELGALVCTKREPDCTACPLQDDCAWQAAGAPKVDFVVRRQPRYEGSDRQARGRLLAALRDADEPLARASLLAEVANGEQAERALSSLIADGLVVDDATGLRLP